MCESRKKTIDMTRVRAGARGRLGMLSVPKTRAPPVQLLIILRRLSSRQEGAPLVVEAVRVALMFRRFEGGRPAERGLVVVRGTGASEGDETRRGCAHCRVLCVDAAARAAVNDDQLVIGV